jgi:hypothetical protein
MLWSLEETFFLVQYAGVDVPSFYTCARRVEKRRALQLYGQGDTVCIRASNEDDQRVNANLGEKESIKGALEKWMW